MPVKELLLIIFEIEAVIVYFLSPVIAKSLISLIDFDEFFDEFRISVGVRMVLFGKLVVSLFDGLKRAGGRDVEDSIVVELPVAAEAVDC